MKFFLHYFVLLISGVALSSCSSSDETLSEEPRQTLPQSVERDVSYGESSQQVYDMYLPAGRTSATTKTLIIIHGGSWVSGDKADLQGYVALAQEAFPDYAIINMNYRLANGSSIPAFPNQLNDIDKVISQLSESKQDLQINGEFALLGMSAGAHLATLYDYDYDPNDVVKAVINIVGPVDFTDPFYSNNSGFQFLFNSLVDADSYASNVDLPSLLSPAKQVTSQSSPTINFYGNQDTLVALSQLASLENALSENNVPFESTIYDGGHGNWSQEQYADVQSKIKAFLKLHF